MSNDSNNIINRCREFIETGLWRKDSSELGRLTRSAYGVLKIVVMTIREFIEQKATVRASALTYYTLLSLVPALALAFAIAKGFGLESLLTNYLRQNLNSDELTNYVMGFATGALENTKGGIIAGVGVVMLLYSVFKLLNNIEAAFNAMWCVSSSRSMVRKLTDYVCIMIFTPILLIMALSANIVLRSSLKEYLNGSLSPLQDLLLGFAPYVILWLVFSLLYLVLPNTKVQIKAAVVSGIITGTAFQLVQWAYITVQIGMNSAGAIYGSFAFLPLLLAWLQLTWTIVLAGCKIAFSIQNVSRYSMEHGVRVVSANLRRRLSLLIMYKAVKAFESHGHRPSGLEMAEDMEISQPLYFSLAEKLKAVGLLAELKADGDKEPRTFIPAIDVNEVTPNLVCAKLDALGDDDKIHLTSSDDFAKMCAAADAMREKGAAAGNTPLKDM